MFLRIFLLLQNIDTLSQCVNNVTIKIGDPTPFVCNICWGRIFTLFMYIRNFQCVVYTYKIFLYPKTLLLSPFECLNNKYKIKTRTDKHITIIIFLCLHIYTTYNVTIFSICILLQSGNDNGIIKFYGIYFFSYYVCQYTDKL